MTPTPSANRIGTRTGTLPPMEPLSPSGITKISERVLIWHVHEATWLIAYLEQVGDSEPSWEGDIKGAGSDGELWSYPMKLQEVSHWMPLPAPPEVE